ncbi:FimV/HubP family polar landmark protein [Pseudomonas sp.]|uniref:FimV/HubP family polar landmark protein n=1 Tax=Pseudomonas sp. TaxID=306 RepID=UPI00273745D3|nr:FimV/HubP family polar landmark protein [Pseudomonas sp.]MDP3816493.1 FimV/HubP family polar landmark protein [Pseudomonas sp.]
MARVRQLLIGLASGSALYSGMVPALGLGEITLHSALSQPLDAEIELLNIGDLTDSDLRVRLAPIDVFNRSGVDRLYFLNDLRFTPLLRGGRSVIRVASVRPVREPYLSFIVEVAQASGQLYREYTVLLDPPGSSAYRSLAVAPTPAALPAAAPVTPTSEASPARASAPLPAAEQEQRYTVLSGDSLWKIAARLREAGSLASQQALMSDIQALNPQAFSQGDINRLRAGAELLLPDSASSPPAVAPATPATADTAAEQAVPELVAAGQAAGELPVDPAAQLLVQEQNLADQELTKQIAETTRLQQGLAELELQVQQMQEQMAARDRQIAGLQAELAARQAATASPATLTQAPLVAPANEPAAGEQSDNWLKGGLALLALLFAAMVGVLWRARNRPVEPPAPTKPLPQPVMATAKAAGVEPKQPAPAVTVSVREAPVPAWSAADGSDALQSANVYIAYGRLGEAEDTLRKAAQAQPQRSDIGFRLLEVLAQLGDAQGFVEQETSLRAAGFSPVRIDELKARHAELFEAPPAELLGDPLLQLDEAPAELPAEDSQLNLDELSLDADWDMVSPFSPTAPSKLADEAGSSAAAQGKTSDVFGLAGSRDPRSPFAESMLVEETPNDDWLDDELDAAFVEQPKAPGRAVVSDLDDLAGSRDNLAKLNMALAYIEQGSLDSACSILNEVINSGDEKQKQRARQLLAKIA